METQSPTHQTTRESLRCLLVMSVSQTFLVFETLAVFRSAALVFCKMFFNWHWSDVLLMTVLCLVAQLCLNLCDPMDCSLPGFSVPGDSPGKNTGVGCHALLQGIFPTQGLNPDVPHCRWILYHLSQHELD